MFPPGGRAVPMRWKSRSPPRSKEVSKPLCIKDL